MAHKSLIRNNIRRMLCHADTGPDHVFYYRAASGRFLGSQNHSEAELRTMLDLALMSPDESCFGCSCVSAIWELAQSPYATDYRIQQEIRAAKAHHTAKNPWYPWLNLVEKLGIRKTQ